MKFFKYCVTATCLAIAMSCSDNGQKQAEALLKDAQKVYEMGDYNAAKVLLDSIESAYPKCFDVRKAGRVLGYKVDLAIEENTQQETDKLIQIYAEKINETTQKYFTYLKSEYDELGRYVFKGSETENNVQRSYIHAAIDEYGVAQLISTYSGGKKINHTALRIVNSKGESVTTHSIPYNDGSNYRYDIDGTFYETVTYVGDKDNNALAFIAANSDDKGLKAFFLCPKDGSDEMREVAVAISQKEREALAASYELGVVLAEQLSFIQQNKVAQGKILFLQNKLNTKE